MWIRSEVGVGWLLAADKDLWWWKSLIVELVMQERGQMARMFAETAIMARVPGYQDVEAAPFPIKAEFVNSHGYCL